MALVAHTDSELDEARIARYVRAFQEAIPLTIGELWALPTMLRLVLLENLRRLVGEDDLGMGRTAASRAMGKEHHRRPEPRRRRRRTASRGDTPPALTRPERSVRRPADPGSPRSGAGDQALERLEDELTRRGSDPNEVLRREHAARPPIR